jgi:hypothetical protein
MNENYYKSVLIKLVVKKAAHYNTNTKQTNKQTPTHPSTLSQVEKQAHPRGYLIEEKNTQKQRWKIKRQTFKQNTKENK